MPPGHNTPHYVDNRLFPNAGRNPRRHLQSGMLREAAYGTPAKLSAVLLNVCAVLRLFEVSGRGTPYSPFMPCGYMER